MKRSISLFFALAALGFLSQGRSVADDVKSAPLVANSPQSVPQTTAFPPPASPMACSTNAPSAQVTSQSEIVLPALRLISKPKILPVAISSPAPTSEQGGPRPPVVFQPVSSSAATSDTEDVSASSNSTSAAEDQPAAAAPTSTVKDSDLAALAARVGLDQNSVPDRDKWTTSALNTAQQLAKGVCDCEQRNWLNLFIKAGNEAIADSPDYDGSVALLIQMGRSDAELPSNVAAANSAGDK